MNLDERNDLSRREQAVIEAARRVARQPWAPDSLRFWSSMGELTMAVGALDKTPMLFPPQSPWPPPTPCKTCSGTRSVGGKTGFNYDYPAPCPDCLELMPTAKRGFVIDPTDPNHPPAYTNEMRRSDNKVDDL